nr:MAG TPA_asm: Helix-turn-helix XRE-family like protein [Caudoviricetes sp.]
MLNTDRIKARLEELNMTQADLAAVISVAVPTMCQKINNIRPLSLDEAEKISIALQIPNTEFGSYFFSS